MSIWNPFPIGRAQRKVRFFAESTHPIRRGIRPALSAASINKNMYESNIIWQFPPANCVLASNAAHVWCTPSDLDGGESKEFYTTLSAHDLEAAAKLGSRHLRQRYISSRALLRNILSRYLGTPANELTFSSTPSGQPILGDEHSASGLRFSISHSGDLSLIAITKNSAIGVDIEKFRSISMPNVIASQFFTTRESAELRRMHANIQLESFFNCWTRKEAYLKAVGLRASPEAAKIEVSINPEDPARILSIGNSASEEQFWTLRTIVPASGYVAALAIRKPDLHLSCLQWPKTDCANLTHSYRCSLSAKSN